MKQNQFINFLAENLKRLFTKSPMFFKIWTIISSILVAITGVPDLATSLGWHIPNLWDHNITQAVAWASRAATFMALLTTQSTPLVKTQAGDVLKVTDETQLPFTAVNEKKSAIKNDIPVAEIKEVTI